MKWTTCSLVYLITIAGLMISAPQARSGRPKKKPKYTPPPAPAPSVDLSRFVSANIEKILGPPEAKAPMPRAELAQLRASFAGRFSQASLSERAQFQTALAVCDALSKAMDERDKAAFNPAASNWSQRSAQLSQNIQQLMESEKAAENGTTTPAR